MEIRVQSTFWTLLRKVTKPFLSAHYEFEGDLSRERPCLPSTPGLLVRLYRGGADMQAAIDVLVPAGLGAADISARLQRSGSWHCRKSHGRLHVGKFH